MGEYKDLVTGIVGVILSAIMFVASIDINSRESNIIGAGFMPAIAAAAMFILFAVVAYYGYKHVRSGEKGKAPDYKPNYAGVVTIVVVMLVYAALIRELGFVLSSIAFLIISIIMMTKKEEMKPVKFVVVSVISVVLIYIVFSQIFGIRLPKGILNF